MIETSQATFTFGALPSGVRDYNERLLLTMIRRLGPVAASDLARLSTLSAQTVSVILRKLESDGLLLRGEPQRGRVGKPSIPYLLDPDGAFGFGMKLGRRSADLTLIDMIGQVRDQLQLHYDYPRPDKVLGFLRDGIAQMTSDLPADHQANISGLGLAMPFDLWKWNEEVGASKDDIAVWQSIDMPKEISAFFDAPVIVTNDATAGCHAEALLRTGDNFTSYAYLFVGFFMGGGIVLNASVYEGPTGNAGGMGPLRTANRDGESAQLMDIASLHRLETRIDAADGDPTRLWDGTTDWSRFGSEVSDWIDEAAFAIAGAAMSACALLDFEAVVSDGAFPEAVRAELVAAIRHDIAGMDSRGLVVPQIVEGQIGANARAIGAGYSPIAARHFLTGASAFETKTSPLSA